MFKLLVSIFVTFAACSARCPEYATEYKNKCFVGIPKLDSMDKNGNDGTYRPWGTAEKVTFTEALKMCNEIGGNLPSVHSEEELEQISHAIYKLNDPNSCATDVKNETIIKMCTKMGFTNTFWVGGIDYTGKDDWHWVDGTKFDKNFINACPARGIWSKWQEGPCNDTCGMFGTKVNTRTCLTEPKCPCEGPKERTLPCPDNVCMFPRPSCADGHKRVSENGKFVCSLNVTEGNTLFEGQTESEVKKGTKCLSSTELRTKFETRDCNEIDSVVCAIPKFKDCPTGWNSINGSCYKLVKQTLNQAEASKACQKENAELASIHNQDTNDVLAAELKDNTQAWIGLEQNYEKIWWSDNTKYDFTLWKGPEQKITRSENPKKVCYTLHITGEPRHTGWNVQDCETEAAGFFCKLKDTKIRLFKPCKEE